MNQIDKKDKLTEFRKIIFRWDPLGVVPSGAPSDEYDDLVVEVMSFLDSNPDSAVADVERLLTEILNEHYGIVEEDLEPSFRQKFVEDVNRISRDFLRINGKDNR